jgi:hypothetical protein
VHRRAVHSHALLRLAAYDGPLCEPGYGVNRKRVQWLAVSPSALQAIFVSSAHRATLSEESFSNYDAHMRLAEVPE